MPAAAKLPALLAGSPVLSAGSVAHTAVADRALAGATAAGVASTAGATLRGIGTGIQAGQVLIGAARGRTINAIAPCPTNGWL